MRVTSLYERKKPVISMEFFPPRNEKAAETFGTTIANLAALKPDYMSIHSVLAVQPVMDHIKRLSK